MTIYNKCRCGARKPKDSNLCPQCREASIQLGRPVRVRIDAPRHPGRIGGVAGVTGGEVQVRMNTNGTKWFRVGREWLEPVAEGPAV